MTTNPLPPPPSFPPPAGPPVPSPPGPPVPPGPPGPPKRVWDDKGNRVVLIGLAIAGGLFVLLTFLVVVIAAVTPKTTTTTTAAAVPTYLAPAPPSTAPASTTPPTTASPPTTKAADYVPTPADFTLEVVEIKRSCFGSAGCNVTFKINPTYNGPPVNSSKSYTVVYEVRGGDDVDSDNFTMRGSNASVNSDDHISTPPNPTLTAEVTRVLG